MDCFLFFGVSWESSLSGVVREDLVVAAPLVADSWSAMAASAAFRFLVRGGVVKDGRETVQAQSRSTERTRCRSLSVAVFSALYRVVNGVFGGRGRWYAGNLGAKRRSMEWPGMYKYVRKTGGRLAGGVGSEGEEGRRGVGEAELREERWTELIECRP